MPRRDKRRGPGFPKAPTPLRVAPGDGTRTNALRFADPAADEETRVHVQGIFGKHTRQPLVELEVDDRRAVLDLATARMVGLWLLEAAEAGSTDALLVSFLEREGHAELQIAQILRLFRNWRRRERPANHNADALAMLVRHEQAATEQFLERFLTEAKIEADARAAFLDEWRRHRAETPVLKTA